MNYADIKKVDVANGPGVRVSLFVSGCTHHCKECFNPETWDFTFGSPFGEEQITQILGLLDRSYIRGLSLLGGEPFSKQCWSWCAGCVRSCPRRISGATPAISLRPWRPEK